GRKCYHSVTSNAGVYGIAAKGSNQRKGASCPGRGHYTKRCGRLGFIHAPPGVVHSMECFETVRCCSLYQVAYWVVRSTFHRLCIVVADIVQHMHLLYNTETTDGTSNARSTT
ncbi:unnamed protein product, partial [Ectocarpus sp. 12 AP-2014]